MTAWGVYDVSQSVQNCDYNGAAVNTLTMLPFGRIAKVGSIVFKSEHVLKHLTETNIPQNVIEQSIRKDLIDNTLNITYDTRRILIKDELFEYRAFRLPDGTINVGTYFRKENNKL